MSEFAGKKIVVAGLGVTGASTARVLLEEGANVFVTEAKSTPDIDKRAALLRAAGAEVEVGGHSLGSITADVAVVSPGIPPGSEVIRGLEESGIPIISEIELAYRFAKCDLLAVTGTNGKTTTTSLLAAILRAAGIDSVAAGNIGLPLIDAVRRVSDSGVIAVEVSSFQLAYVERFRPRVAVLLNVAEDHTDWHGSITSYAEAKARILENQGPDDHAVVNRDDQRVVEIARAGAGETVTFSLSDPGADAFLRDGVMYWHDEPIADATDVALQGAPGWADSLAAAAAALAYGVDLDSVRRALTDFTPLHHRMEVVGSVDGVTYIDDSKATNPHATLAAVGGLRDVVLIAGGRSKGIDLSALAAVAPPVIGVVAIGEAAEELVRIFDGRAPVVATTTMEEAVARASEMSVPGGSVLLSPGCASLDMYSSYAERGEAFARAARALGARRTEDGR